MASLKDYPTSVNLYLIDFGLTERINTEDCELAHLSDNARNNWCHLSGNKYFMSLNAMLKRPPSYKDDLESLFYTLIFLYKG